MKKTFSLVLTLMIVFSAFAMWTIPASADEGIVQDGLVSWFDGNDYDGTTWIDKKGENDILDCVDGTFQDGAYVLDQAQQLLPNELYDVLRGEEFTVEINFGAFSNYPDTGYTTWLCNNSGTTAEKVSFYIQLNKGTMDTFKAKTSGIASASRPAFNNATETLQDATLAITFKVGEKTNVYVNGELIASAASPATNANADVGGSPKFILGNAGVNNKSNTAFEGLRFYDRALSADEVKTNADVDNAPATPEGPAEIEITPYAKGWENWTGGTGGEQTQLLITAPIVPDATTKAYTWEITIGDKTITLKSSSQYNFGNGNAIWRFETCLAEGDNQYIPENGTSGTVSAKIYNEAGELVYVAKAAADATWEVTMDPIVPEVEEPIDPPAVDEPIDPPADDDGAGQAGDAAVYATILVAVAAVALVVISKKRTNI